MQGRIQKFYEWGGCMIGSNIYGWRGIEETGGQGDDSPSAGIPCGNFEAELASVEMMIFIHNHVAKFLAKGKY